MKFYAYKPTKDDTEPIGTENRMLFELKTLRGAINRTKIAYGNNYMLYTYTNFYDEETFRLVAQEPDPSIKTRQNGKSSTN